MTFTSGRTGVSGCALFTANGWKTATGEFSNPSFDRQKQRIYLASRNGIYIRNVPGTLAFEHLQMPGDSWVNRVVAGPSGELWLGTSDGVFRYRPGHTPPRVQISTLDSEVPHDKPMRVSFS
ncbi:MAG: hypothetical protein PF495_14100, partial [Spirochaetales bacterium]|nr:hypothetical protein [Spirochaetales bacterium]